MFASRLLIEADELVVVEAGVVPEREQLVLGVLHHVLIVHFFLFLLLFNGHPHVLLFVVVFVPDLRRVSELA